MTTDKPSVIEPPFPRVLRIEPASKCNLACTHCPTGTIEMPRGIMQDDVFSKILDSIKEKKNYIKVVVLYHGGEPLMNKNFFEMAAQVRSHLPLSFIKSVSNGMILTQKNSEKLIHSGIDLIEFSLDGISASNSDEIRVNSDAHRIINNIKYLLNLKEKYTETRLKVAITSTQFITKEQSFPLTDPPNPEWLVNIFQNRVQYKTTWAMRWPHMKILNDTSDQSKGKIYNLITDKTSVEKNNCDHVINRITIRHNGDVVPCCFDLTSKLIMGNILKNSLSDIWKSSIYKNLRESISGKKYQSICNTCSEVKQPVYLQPNEKINNSET